MKTKKIKTIVQKLDSIPMPDKDKILSFCPEALKTPEVQYTAPIKRKFRLRAAILAALVLTFVIGGVSVLTAAAEEREYNAAVAFFNENNLNADGLTRSDIKNVYRDISTGKFVYGKTAEVIEKNVGGHEIFREDPTPEDLENLWNYKNNGYYIITPQTGKGIEYKSEEINKFDSVLGFDVFDKTILTKYVDGREVWKTELGFYVDGKCVDADGKTIAFGQNLTYSSAQKTNGFIALVDSDGKVLWEKALTNAQKNEYIESVIYEGDRITVFSRCDFKSICFSKLDMNGSVISFKENEIGNSAIKSAVKLGDGYLILLNNNETGNIMMKVNPDGSLSDSFTYSSDDNEYFITGMIEYGGSVYLSAYSVPKLNEGKGTAGGRYDIAAVLNYIFDNNYLNIPNDELTKRVRDNFTAVLLECDIESGVPREFYSAKGSLGAALSISDEGNLIWSVENITDTFFSPMTSSFTIGGASYVYRYEFDNTGKILSMERTDEVVAFRR
ncbi:MAG: hypothetical protein VB118_09930 [Oscillospiraceae bacterium]|nr:hypothetical protein [Oscillospiraceae bacterium]